MPHTHPAPTVGNRHFRVIHLEPQQVLAREQEVARIPLGVKGNDVVGQKAFDHLIPDDRGQHAPVVRLRPRDVHEEVQEGIWDALADDSGGGVQVVVVQHDHGARVVGEGADHGVGEQTVGGEIAVLPRRELLHADVRHV